MSFKGKRHTEETKKLMAENFKGRSHTDEVKKRISETKKLAYQTGAVKHPRGTLGKKRSDEAKEKQRAAMKKRVSDGVHNTYLVDRSQLKKKQEQNDVAYQEWRRSVWERDGFKCKISNSDCSGRIEAHHILSWRDHSELRYETNNGITLCKTHHPRKHEEETRLSPFFQSLIMVK